MKKVRFGIIGMGNQGTYYANLLKDGKVDNGILSAICDNNPKIPPAIPAIPNNHARPLHINATNAHRPINQNRPPDFPFAMIESSL
jgi:hypothetical protein